MTILDRLHSSAENGGTALALLSGFARRIIPPIRADYVDRSLESPSADPIPRFSVIIPCYNYAQFLEQAVLSAVTQVGVDAEVIIVDDASTDGSAELATQLATEHSNIRVIRNSVNSGHVVTFNNGFKMATGDYIVRLDADDLLTPGSLKRSAAVFESFPRVGLVYGRPRHFEGNVPPKPVVGTPRLIVWLGQNWVAERCCRAVNCITTPEAVVRASVMRDIGALNTSLKFAQDMEMWLRAASVSDVGWIGGVDQALHRDHSGSMSVTVGAGYMTDLRERRAVFEILFDRMARRIRNADELRSSAMRNLAREALGVACQAYNRGKVSQTPVDELVEFAGQTWAGYEGLSEFRALQRRRRVGKDLSPYIPVFLAAALKRRMFSELAYARWLTSGV